MRSLDAMRVVHVTICILAIRRFLNSNKTLFIL